ncbi:MAG: hypothetical protein ACOY90_20130 [Candidatus Zhuqueibacterota bacterium]
MNRCPASWRFRRDARFGFRQQWERDNSRPYFQDAAPGVTGDSIVVVIAL